MSIYETMSVPFRYIDLLEQKQHILLLYEDPEYARLIEFRFIKNGLASGERCVYVTGEDSGYAVLKFLSYGIQLSDFQSGKMRVIQIQKRHGTKEQMVKQCRADALMILENLIPPYRIAGRIVPNVDEIDGISTQIELEKEAHSRFDDMRGSILCTYDISKIERTRRKNWIEKLYQSHHAVISAPKFGQGGVVCPC